jgi:hypothetical protein
MRTADPMGLDVQRVWQVVTTEVRAAIDQLQQIKPTIPAHLRQVEANVSEFLRDHPMYAKNVFLIMRFQRSRQRAHIYRVIREEMEARGFKVFRADTKEYAEDLWANVCVYMLGCARAIAVFEQIETTDFYPNLALEVGFMFALGKPVLLLKDEKVDMPADLIGKLYRPFAANRLGTLRTELTKWMDEVAGPGLEITKRGSRRTAIAGSSRA